MVQCEMCGAETQAPKTVKIEGAELDVCDSCAQFGTEVRTTPRGGTSTKYSTSSASGTRSTSAVGRSSGGEGGRAGGGRPRRRDMFDEMEELAEDYDERIRNAREDEGLSQEELADQLNEKASLIRKLERGSILPSDEVQRKLERKLGISLTEGGEADEVEWSSGTSGGTTTLGDVVRRRD